MFTKWTDHLKEEAKESFQKEILSAKRVLERATAIFQQSIDGVEKVELGAKVYDNPSWAYKQAHMNGYKAGLTAAIELLNLDNQEHNNGRLISTTRAGQRFFN